MLFSKLFIACYFKNKNENLPEQTDTKSNIPADGGLMAWIVCICSAWSFGLYVGFEFNYGLLYNKMLNMYNGTENYVIYSGWIGSTAIGLQNLFCLPGAIAADLFGARKVAIVGAVLSTLGLLTSAFVTQLPVYFATYGIIFGTGQAFMAQSAYQILPHYFNKKLGLANGIMNLGGSVVVVIVLVVSSVTLESLGLKNTLFILTGFSFTTIITSMTLKSVLTSGSSEEKEMCAKLKKSIGTEVLKIPSFHLWWICGSFALFGQAIPYVTIDNFCQLKFPDSPVHLLNILYAIGMGFAAIVVGRLLDYAKFSHIYFHSIAYFILGFGLIGVVLAPNFVVLCIFYCCTGGASGIYTACISPIALQVSGSKLYVSQAIGFFHTFKTAANILAPVISGLMFTSFGNYDYSYYMGAAFNIIGAVALLFYPSGIIVEKIELLIFRIKVRQETNRRASLIQIEEIKGPFSQRLAKRLSQARNSIWRMTRRASEFSNLAFGDKLRQFLRKSSVQPTENMIENTIRRSSVSLESTNSIQKQLPNRSSKINLPVLEEPDVPISI